MKKINLGKTDLEIAPVIFGGNVFGWTLNENESFKILDQFVDDGFNAIDTANVYSRWVDGNQGGESETIIGNWIKKSGKRQHVIISTKVGADMGSGNNLKKDYIINEVEHALKRLQTDYIDLYFSHYDDERTPVEEPLMAYEQLLKDGKIRWIGASNFSAPRLKEALHKGTEANLPVYHVYQPGYNLYDREGFEREHEKICLEHDLGVITYSSLANGFLTGKYRNPYDMDKSVRGKGMKKYLNERGERIIKALNEVATHHGLTEASIALAWLMMHPSISAPIASATSLAQLKSFIEAANVQLSPSDISKLDSASVY